jgi:hypothetical protein
MSYAVYTQQCNEFLRRSRQELTIDLECVRFINGMANFHLHTQARSHRSLKGYKLKLVEPQNFLNDIVTDSPHMGGVKSPARPSTRFGGAQPTKKRTY